MTIYDTYWADCGVALAFDGSHGSQAITDAKGNAVTVVGDAALSSTWSAAGGTSLYLANNYTVPHLTLASAAVFNQLGTGPYTIECWIKPEALTGKLLDVRDSEGGGWGLYLYGGTLTFDSAVVLEATGITLGSVSHVAVSSDGSTHRLFINGELRASETIPASLSAPGAALFVGCGSSQEQGYQGWIDQLYIVGAQLYAAAFTPLAPTFDGASGPVEDEPTVVGTGTASFSGTLAVVSPLVFETAQHYVKWYATVIVGGVDVSARLTGTCRVSGGEDAARLLSFSVIPASPAELAGYDSAAVTLDVTLFRTGQTATYRRFTGRVEAVRFSPASRVAEIDCRDGWQERPAACATADQVEALFGGLAQPCAKIVAWNSVTPDPVAYFNGLLATLRGATAIDSSGIWQVVPWSIGTPAASFGPGDVFADSVELSRPNRADVPSAIVATLSHRYNRLHAAEKNLAWQAVERARYVVDGLPTAPKSMIAAALSGASGWLVKGSPVIVEPTPGVYPVIVGGQTVPYVVSHEAAAITCQSFTATLYRRWYQQVEVRYRISIDMGGASERDDAIAVGIESTFDAGAWESGPKSEADTGIYQANAPTVAVPPTGYEGLPEPWPPANGALDHAADIDNTLLQSAARHVVALAVRKAAQGKRRQTVRFARPLDPRWEIGSVLAVSAYGVAATGQVVEFDESLDHDSGLVESTYRLACPAGSGTTTGYTASVTPPAVTVSHLLTMPALGNHVGASLDTPATPDEATLLGFLCNVLPTSDNYAPTKPVYQPQFRLVMPEIPAAVRDPLVIDAAITSAVQIAGSGVEVTF